jgi:hypothetical protein
MRSAAAQQFRDENKSERALHFKRSDAENIGEASIDPC